MIKPENKIILSYNIWVASSYVATEYRLLFFEVAKITPSFYVGIALILIFAITNYVDVVLDYKESLKAKKKTNTKAKFIVFTSLISVFSILIILGLLIH